MYSYLVRYAYRTCHADGGSQAWAKVEREREIEDAVDLAGLELAIRLQRNDSAEIFIKDFKLVDRG